ncbi:hypothetical protein B9Z55_015481 [Caenorhabditis nigoni]|nr:hypothetical protein B9Z55_015481 [Caenorhabditis nigoni]
MIIIGDLLQLQMGDDGQQTSEAHLLDEFEFYELQEIHRQDRDPIFRDFLKRARTADLDPSMLQFINDRLTHRGVGYLDEVLQKQIQCVHHANSSLAYEAVPESQSFAIAAGVRIITTASMMDKDGETVPNGTIGTVISFSKLCEHIHYVNIQFDGSQKTQRFGRQNPHGTEILSFNFQPSYALTYHRAQRRTMNGVVLDIQGKMYAGAFYTGISRVRDASRVFFNCKISKNLKND